MKLSQQEIIYKLNDLIDKEIFKDSVILSVNERSLFLSREIGLKNGLIEGDILFIEPIFSPINKETIIGNISELKEMIIIEEFKNSFDITDDYIYNEANRIYEEKIISKMHKFRTGESIISIENKNVLLIDLGINTGLTMLNAIKSCINAKVFKINVATAFISKEAAEKLENIVDNLFYIQKIEDYVNTEFYIKENE
ncbi:putative phosphoribosyl transferase [Lebetimonas natsushimae]|uniref:Putative phosphoribosyl transferase n=1 Tax=Lebetimonas natsushimae TaxID=1936991 RepID=A0A292YH65_9BACT|nr:phosphoribosyltransferase family protein [Lebetimonas natsushimae]GAX88135.1 putative phosphoribosyl transferase [Lebetimonas natsushimae]